MKKKILALYLAVTIVLSILTIIDLQALSFPERFGYGPLLLAKKLAEKPEKYVSLANPDPYLLHAISNPEKEVFIGSWENTQFDEMVQTYGTNNAEFNGNYYEINMLIGDAFAYGTYFWLLIVSWGILGISIIILYLRRNKNSVQNKR